MRKIFLILSLSVLFSSCDEVGYRGNMYYDDSQPEGYYGKERYPSGDSYYEDRTRNPQNEPRTNWRLW